MLVYSQIFPRNRVYAMHRAVYCTTLDGAQLSITDATSLKLMQNFSYIATVTITLT